MPETSSSLVLLLTADLATSSKVAGAAARQNVMLDVAYDVASLTEKASARQPALVIVDLSVPRLDVAALVMSLKQNVTAPRGILAFGPHVHEGLLQAARDAGCDAVLSRGQFHARVDELLQAASSGGSG
jgi:AmiR/NasT family two-component response regulator